MAEKKQFTVHLTDEISNKLDELCEYFDLSRSRVIALAIEGTHAIPCQVWSEALRIRNNNNEEA